MNYKQNSDTIYSWHHSAPDNFYNLALTQKEAAVADYIILTVRVVFIQLLNYIFCLFFFFKQYDRKSLDFAQLVYTRECQTLARTHVHTWLPFENSFLLNWVKRFIHFSNQWKYF